MAFHCGTILRAIVGLQLAVLGMLCALTVRGDEKKAEPGSLASYDAKITALDRKHWSYQPVRKPAVPQVKNAGWVRNPIDAFVIAQLEAKGWRPATPATPHALLRRLHLDLVGLPPTLAEQDAFAEKRKAVGADQALDAVVNDLLRRPTYGERWARHWLDVVRYAESNGYERDAAKPFVWRYRDYVIRALNDDKPFDRFIVEQIAGDELDDASAETLIATGFLRVGPWDDEPADPLEDRFDQLDDIVSTTSLAFLGLTMGCARCHNHKFDALTMHDYYRLAAVFAPLERPRNGRVELDRPIGDREQLRRLALRDRRIADLRKGAPKDGPIRAAIEAEVKKLLEKTTDLPRGYTMTEATKLPTTHLLLRGKAGRPGPVVQPGMPAVLVKDQPKFPEASLTSSLRRLTLAEWIASPDNPLTARVIVNRVWQQHFGFGLVRTPNDFGVMGQLPTHPELLDWLAATFVESGWSLKKLHRLILTSNTYRMSQTDDAKLREADPENMNLWRFPTHRLEAEAVRDGVLAVSGKLNPTMYGPSVFPAIQPAALAGNSDKEKIWKASNEDEASRRTIYVFQKRTLPLPMLECLDLCDSTRSSERRLTTTTATQALILFNGDFANRQARYFAERLRKEVGDQADRQIDRAFRLALARPANDREKQMLARFLEHEADALRREGASEVEARNRALDRMCLVVLNMNEFVYPD